MDLTGLKSKSWGGCTFFEAPEKIPSPWPFQFPESTHLLEAWPTLIFRPGNTAPFCSFLL